MARFDKTEPHIGTFRVRLEENWLEADVGRVRAISVNGSGRAVKGNPLGSSGLKGLVALGLARPARHPIDGMTFGEILEITTDDVTGAVAGANVYAPTTGATGQLTTVAAGGIYVGHLVEADRLVVRFVGDTTAGA